MIFTNASFFLFAQVGEVMLGLDLAHQEVWLLFQYTWYCGKGRRRITATETVLPAKGPVNGSLGVSLHSSTASKLPL